MLSYVVFSLIRTTLLLTTRTRPIWSTVSFDILISELSYIAEYILLALGMRLKSVAADQDGVGT